MTQLTGFYHNVYFWLADGAGNDTAHALAVGCRKHLTGIPGVVRLTIGTPAGTPREVVDNSYGIALLVEFADSAAHDVYQDHPDHLRFIAECSHLWRSVKIYDTVPVFESS